MHKLYCEKESLTMGQLYLLDICDNRQVTDFSRIQLNNEFDVSRLMKLATGALSIPPFKLIYLMKDFVDPVYWFYTKEEYVKIYRDRIINYDSYTENYKESINYKTLQKIQSEQQLWSYCETRYGPKFKTMYLKLFHLLTERNNLSIRLIQELQPEFPIENWFIK